MTDGGGEWLASQQVMRENSPPWASPPACRATKFSRRPQGRDVLVEPPSKSSGSQEPAARIPVRERREYHGGEQRTEQDAEASESAGESSLFLLHRRHLETKWTGMTIAASVERTMTCPIPGPVKPLGTDSDRVYELLSGSLGSIETAVNTS
jgi:hypothetical protein